MMVNKYSSYFCSIALFAALLLLYSCAECDASVEQPQKDEVIQARLLSMEFLAKDNPVHMIEDIECSIIGDSIVECYIPYILDDKMLIARFNAVGGAYFDGILSESGKTVVDFSKPIDMLVKSGNVEKHYLIYVHTFTGLPIVWIDTNDRQDISIRDQYVRGYFRMVEGVVTRGAGDITEDSISIKGRGNTTWTKPKKPYRLKFDHKQALFGHHEDKSWILLANYCDKTMLRIATAFYMSSISNLEYTPKCHFVELMLNGRYNGTYLLCEKLKIADYRVNAGKDGFLVEIDVKRPEDAGDARYFSLSHLGEDIYANVKEPDVEYGDNNYNYISSFVSQAEDVLFSPSFRDPDKGWAKYMDMDSFVDWFLVNEIAKNNDACFYSSCFMSLRRGEKLKMGPVWDFDIAFGNVNYGNSFQVEGFHVTAAAWISRMMEDPVFYQKVRNRFNYFYEKKDDIMAFINNYAHYLRLSADENDNRWHTLYTETWPNYDIWGSYYNEVQSMKIWLDKRFEWLKGEFDKGYLN